MKVVKIDKKAWQAGIDKSRAAYRLFGTVREKDYHMVRELEKSEFPDMENKDTILSPKALLFPQTEKMLWADLDASKENHHIMKPVENDYSPRAVIGIKPYDAKAVKLLELNFDTPEYKDPYFCDALAATTFVGLAVNSPWPFDFSLSAGSGPFDESGLDVMLVDIDDNTYLAKVITEKGTAFLEACGFTEQPDEKSALAQIEEMKEKAEKAVSSNIDCDRLKEKNLLALYDAPFWDDIAFSCINCGTCTFVCPTCWCFDIQDESKDNTCVRMRNWDTCMSPLFTRHASGHNPRGEKVSRVRQRFMHKLKYFLDKYDQGIMCVGCGRCVKHCPVNIDIREVCEQMNTYEEKA